MTDSTTHAIANRAMESSITDQRFRPYMTGIERREIRNADTTSILAKSWVVDVDLDRRNRQSCTRRRAGPQRPRHERRSREGRGRERSCPDSACRIAVPTCQMLISFERCPSSGPNRTILHAILRSNCMRDVTEHVGIPYTERALEDENELLGTIQGVE